MLVLHEENDREAYEEFNWESFEGNKLGMGNDETCKNR